MLDRWASQHNQPQREEYARRARAGKLKNIFEGGRKKGQPLGVIAAARIRRTQSELMEKMS